jgi:hypothetical protein
VAGLRSDNGVVGRMGSWQMWRAIGSNSFKYEFPAKAKSTLMELRYKYITVRLLPGN